MHYDDIQAELKQSPFVILICGNYALYAVYALTSLGWNLRLLAAS